MKLVEVALQRSCHAVLDSHAIVRLYDVVHQYSDANGDAV